jgi:hypothetical protein
MRTKVDIKIKLYQILIDEIENKKLNKKIQNKIYNNKNIKDQF